MKPIFKFISIFFIVLNFNLFADCTKFSNVGLKQEILKVDYPELYKKYNLSGKDFIFIKDNEWFTATYYSSSQGFDGRNTHLCGENDRTFDEDSFYISGSRMYYIVSFLGNLNSGGKPDPRYNAYSYEFYNIESISNPCQENEVFDPETKQCKSCPEGFFFDPYTKTCESKQKRPKWCPEPMIYKERKAEFITEGYGTVKECLPNPNINEDECKQRGMFYHMCTDALSPAEMRTCMTAPMGCYANETVQRFKAEKQLENDINVWSGFMFPLPINAIKNGWNALSDFMKGLFRSPNPKTPNPNLLEYRPQIVDMKATKNGPEPVFGLRPVNDIDIAINDFFKNTGKTNFNNTNLPKSVDKTPQKIVDISPNLNKFDFPNDA